MARQAEPWRRGGKDWYVTIRGKQVRIAPASATKTQAWAAYRGYLSGGTPRDGSPTFAGIASAFLARQKARLDRGELSAKRYRVVVFFLSRACKAFGRVAVDDLRPRHVNDWLDSTSWGPTTRSDGVFACRSVVRWAIADGVYQGEYPLGGLKSPARRKRSKDVVPRPEELEAIRNARPDQQWRDLMDVLVATGCRPGEIYSLTAADVDFARGMFTVKNKTARATGVARRPVYPTGDVLDILRRLAELHPDGPLFRNTRGIRWRDHSVRIAMVAAGFKTFPYALRHAYGSRGIKSVDVSQLARLMGHTRVTTTLENYVHNLDSDEQLKSAAGRISPGLPVRGHPPGDADSPASPEPAPPKPSARKTRGKPPGGAPRS